MTKGLSLFSLIILLTACTLTASEGEPQVIYITATPAAIGAAGVDAPTRAPPTPTPQPSPTIRVDLSPVPEQIAFQPTANPSRSLVAANRPQSHTVQSGDTLFGIASAYGTSLNAILAANDDLTDPNALFVGQIINLPDVPTDVTPDFKLLPDVRVIRGPGSADFDVAAFIAAQPGYISRATDTVDNRQADGSIDDERLTAAEIVERVALEFSVDPRLLLALLEYRANLLSDPEPSEDRRTHPLISEADSGSIDRSGLYRQLAWAANQINFGYYGWKYRGWTTLEFDGDTRLQYAPGLNAGTVALQYFLSRFRAPLTWTLDISQDGFFSLYWGYFGDPFENALDPVVPTNLQQPSLGLPFAAGETWFYTGGWHGGWGQGSAWAAVDFAPPDDPSTTGGVLCYTSSFDVRAVTEGTVVRTGNGVVVLDLDNDGDESTGWTILYLHLSDTVALGARLQPGDVVGNASCEGGFSTATHLHIGRRFNGEWIPADCSACPAEYARPPFTMGGWQVVGFQNQEYQGELVNVAGERRQAEQGRANPINRVSW